MSTPEQDQNTPDVRFANALNQAMAKYAETHGGARPAIVEIVLSNEERHVMKSGLAWGGGFYYFDVLGKGSSAEVSAIMVRPQDIRQVNLYSDAAKFAEKALGFRVNG